MTSDPTTLRRLQTSALRDDEIRAVRDLLTTAFDRDGEAFGEEDWVHALGGTHFLLELDGRIVAHAAVVPRALRVAHHAIPSGYVEAVGVHPQRQGRGLGTRLMSAVSDHVRDRYRLGALSTGRPSFYERLGWRRWAGPTFVRTREGDLRTAEDDGGILVLLTPASPPIDVTWPISCEWRPGDVW